MTFIFLLTCNKHKEKAFYLMRPTYTSVEKVTTPNLVMMCTHFLEKHLHDDVQKFSDCAHISCMKLFCQIINAVSRTATLNFKI
jgi:hypothetical protein